METCEINRTHTPTHTPQNTYKTKDRNSSLGSTLDSSVYVTINYSVHLELAFFFGRKGNKKRRKENFGIIHLPLF